MDKENIPRHLGHYDDLNLSLERFASNQKEVMETQWIKKHQLNLNTNNIRFRFGISDEFKKGNKSIMFLEIGMMLRNCTSRTITAGI
jgi:hypothetical protein